MVVFSCFNVHVVNAETMEPFQEHEKNRKIYIEAEPGAEYFLQISKIKESKTHLCIKSYVDGASLGYLSKFPKDLISPKGLCRGMYHRDEDGNVSMTALKFVRPKLKQAKKKNTNDVQKNDSGEDEDVVDNEMMGRIVLKVYKGMISKNRTPNYASGPSPTLETATVAAPDDTTCFEQKVVRSGVGATTVSGSSAGEFLWVAGREIAQLTLNYCSVKGLVRAGIMPAGVTTSWEEVQKKFPAVGLEFTVQPQRHQTEEGTTVELFDFSNLPDEFEPVRVSEWAPRLESPRPSSSTTAATATPTTPKRPAAGACSLVVTPIRVTKAASKRRRSEKKTRNKKARKNPTASITSLSTGSSSTSTDDNYEEEHSDEGNNLDNLAFCSEDEGDTKSRPLFAKPRFRTGRAELKKAQSNLFLHT